MKRSISFSQPHENLTMANCLMLLSCPTNSSNDDPPSRVFECKTCNRQFTSFQALGGHRASHKKPKLNSDGSSDSSSSSSSPSKPKTHECSICGLEFAIGQALGGHMRRHRAVMNNEGFDQILMKKSSTGRRVLCLDLNLTPYENDLEFSRLGKSAGTTTTIVDCLYR